MCIRIYIFNFKKHQTNKQKKTRIKKAKQAKQTKEEKRNLRKIDLKKEVCIHSGEDFFSSTAFPETRVIFFWPNISVNISIASFYTKMLNFHVTFKIKFRTLKGSDYYNQQVTNLH